MGSFFFQLHTIWFWLHPQSLIITTFCYFASVSGIKSKVDRYFRTPIFKIYCRCQTARKSENGFWSSTSWSRRLLSILHTIFLLPLTEFHSCSEESALEEGSFICSNPATLCFICTVLRHKKKPILSGHFASEWGNTCFLILMLLFNGSNKTQFCCCH